MSLDLDILLNERALELWMECWRRLDLIRFGEFLKPFQEKNYVSDPKYLLFPIPNQQLGVNKNLTQNPGYYTFLPTRDVYRNNTRRYLYTYCD